MEFLSWFDFDVMFVQGISNKVADMLSHYFETDNWTDAHPAQDYIDADVRLDPQHEDLPWERHLELEQDDTAELPLQVAEQMLHINDEHSIVNQFDYDTTKQLMGMTVAPYMYAMIVDMQSEDLTVAQSMGHHVKMTDMGDLDEAFRQDICQGYTMDKLFSKVLSNLSHHHPFKVDNGLMWMSNILGDDMLCIPAVKPGMKLLQGVIIEQAHCTVGHFGPQQTMDYICCWYWWPKLYPLVVKFCMFCNICQKTKDDNSCP
jgi:hypothetical protein